LLEPCTVKVVCTVLRGGRGLYLKPPPLPDRWEIGIGNS